MAEAIAGLSLAANILQMVEYGGVFVTTAWKIWSSQTDSQLVKDFDQLQYLTQDFNNILGSLEQDDPANSSTEAWPDRNRDLLKLGAESRKICEEILGSLNKIGNSTETRAKKRKAIQTAFKLTWNKAYIAELQTKLDHVRSQLTLQLVHSLRCVRKITSILCIYEHPMCTCIVVVVSVIISWSIPCRIRHCVRYMSLSGVV